MYWTSTSLWCCLHFQWDASLYRPVKILLLSTGTHISVMKPSVPLRCIISSQNLLLFHIGALSRQKAFSSTRVYRPIRKAFLLHLRGGEGIMSSCQNSPLPLGCNVLSQKPFLLLKALSFPTKVRHHFRSESLVGHILVSHSLLISYLLPPRPPIRYYPFSSFILSSWSGLYSYCLSNIIFWGDTVTLSFVSNVYPRCCIHMLTNFPYSFSTVRFCVMLTADSAVNVLTFCYWSVGENGSV